MRRKHARLCVECAEVAQRRKAAREQNRRDRDRDRLRSQQRARYAANREEINRRRRKRYAAARKRRVPKRVPCAPLAGAIERIVYCEEAVEPYLELAGRDPASVGAGPRTDDGRRRVVCERAGVATRLLRGWRSGERRRCDVRVADRVLTNLELLWHDVWTPENTSPEEYAIVVKAFGGV